MKIKLLLLVFSILSLFACSKYSGKAGAGSGTAKLGSEIDSVSYSFGVDMGNAIVNLGIKELNAAALVDGLASVLNNDTSNLKIKVKDVRPKIMAYINSIQLKKNEKNKKDGEVFLAENKKKAGVKVTPSGVQYIVIKEGTGPIPNDTSMVKVHYHGTLIDGTVFESSVERKEPVEFPVNRVIKGWQEVLKMMHVGSKWKVFIPEELGYGANVRPGGKIEPYMTLVFEIELLEIVPPKTAEKSATGGNNNEENKVIEGD